MWHFAWRNLLNRPARTALAVAGLSVPIFGVLGLLSLSSGIRNLFGETLSQVPGIMVLRENLLSPVVSDLPAELAETLRRVPGVRTVAPQVWKIAPTIEGRSLFARSALGLLSGSGTRGLTEITTILGMDVVAHNRLRSPLFRSRLLPPERGGGRFLGARDRGQPHIVISTKIAAENPRPDGRPRQVGDTLRIGQQEFQIVGIYDTGSIVLDVTILMDIATARKLLNINEDTVSCFMVEPERPEQTAAVVAAIDQTVPEVDARDMSEFSFNITKLIGQLDVFLMLVVSLAVFVGAIGIVNTMLMSTAERYVEFGVLRTNGWSRGDVLALVSAESLYLGLLSGVLGCILAISGTVLANRYLHGAGLSLNIGGGLIAFGLGLAVLMGLLGGIYPAWRASRLTPMEAIRQGTAR